MREVPDCWEELEHSLELEPDERVEAVVDVPVDEEPENLYSSEESLTYLPHPTEWIVPSNTWKEQEELLPIEESFENIPANLGHQSILRAAESLKDITGSFRHTRHRLADWGEERHPVSVDFDSLFLTVILKVSNEALQAQGDTQIVLFKPVSVVEAAEEKLNVLFKIGRPINVLMRLKVEKLWPLSILRFARRILWAYLRGLDMDSCKPLSLTVVGCTDVSSSFAEPIHDTCSSYFIMENPASAGGKLGLQSLCESLLPDMSYKCCKSLDLLECYFWTTNVNAVLVETAVVYFSDLEVIDNSVLGVIQQLDTSVMGKEAVEHRLSACSIFFQGQAGPWQTTSEKITDSPPLDEVMERALPRAQLKGSLSAEAMWLWTLHAIIRKMIPLRMRDLPPISGNWRMVANTIEAVLVETMELMASPLGSLMDPSSKDAYDPWLLAFLSLPHHRASTLRFLELTDLLPGQNPWEMFVEPSGVAL